MKKIRINFQGYGQSWQVGTLAEAGRDLLFEYSEDAIQRGIEFSPVKLKLRSEAYKGFDHYQNRLPGIFSDCIPDGWGLLLMDRLFAKRGMNIHTVSPLDRLAFIGNGAIGAFAFEPASEEELMPADVTLLGLANEVQQVIEDVDDAALKKLAQMGGSPQGARPKVLVQYEMATRMISNESSATGTPWLVKFQARGEKKEVCAVEHAYARMARLCGLDMPETEYFDLDKNLGAFGIERFDRKNRLRVPTSTLAGLMDLNFRLPGMDYDSFIRVTRSVTKSEAEVKKGFARCVFNVVFNNRDDHTKNFSYRMNDRFEWELAPGYDMTFNHGLGGEHNMAICGEGRNPGMQHLLELAKRSDIRESDAVEVIDQISAVAGTLAVELKEFKISAKTRQEIVQVVEANRSRLVRSVSLVTHS